LPALGAGVLALLCIAAGMFLLVVPGVIIAGMLYVATQCAVLERPGVLGALRRSRELTRGHRVRILGLLCTLGVASWGIRAGVEAMTLSSVEDVPLYVYCFLAEQMILGSIGAVMAGVAYYFLRAEKEGTSAAELAAVFD
jgi:hypothetical protein